METMRAKLPFFLMPVCIIAIVYFVDRGLFWISSSTNAVSEDTPSDPTNSFLEIAAIVLCVVMPAIYFNMKPKTDQQESKVPTPGVASARLRLTSQKSSTEGAGDGTSTKARPLSEMCRAEGGAGQKVAYSKQAADLARWNQAINNAAKAGDPTKAMQLMGDIEKAGLQPDTISYNSVIHAHAKQGDIRSAEKWLKIMGERGVEPNTISYNILMDTCVKANEAAKAEHWLKRMQEDGVEPNEVSYATVIHGRAKTGDSEGAEKCLREMIANGVEPNVVSYN